MKIVFAADMSFGFYSEFPGKEKVKECMREAAEVFEKADFSVLNLESIFGDKDKYTPIRKSGPKLIADEAFAEYVDVLKPTVLGLANNHCRDYGDEALFDTMKLLKQKGYVTIGAGKNIDEAYEPAILEKDGVRIAVIAVCENEPGIAEEHQAGSAGYRLSKVANAVRAAKERGELPIIFFHGGNEYNPFPSPGKTELYRHFVDIGAKAVIAMHTHCPQGYEMYKGCPIVYSMGNFFFPSEGRLATWFYGYMTQLDINDKNIDMEIIPYTFDLTNHRLLKDEEKEHFMKYIAHLNEALSDPQKIRDHFNSWCIIMGEGFLVPNLQFKEEMKEFGSESVLRMKNILCCEAHNEVVSNTFKIFYDGTREKAQEGVAAIKKLQNMEL